MKDFEVVIYSDGGQLPIILHAIVQCESGEQAANLIIAKVVGHIPKGKHVYMGTTATGEKDCFYRYTGCDGHYHCELFERIMVDPRDTESQIVAPWKPPSKEEN